MAELDEPEDEPNFDLCGSFGLDFFSEDELLLTETDLTEQKETTKQTEIGQLNDEDIDNFITAQFYYCSLLAFFLAPAGLGKILRNSQNIRAYYMLNHRIRCTYYFAIAPFYHIWSRERAKYETVIRRSVPVSPA